MGRGTHLPGNTLLYNQQRRKGTFHTRAAAMQKARSPADEGVQAGPLGRAAWFIPRSASFL